MLPFPFMHRKSINSKFRFNLLFLSMQKKNCSEEESESSSEEEEDEKIRSGDDQNEAKSCSGYYKESRQRLDRFEKCLKR